MHLDEGDLALSPVSSATRFTPTGLRLLITTEWVFLTSSFSSVLGGIYEIIHVT